MCFEIDRQVFRGPTSGWRRQSCLAIRAVCRVSVVETRLHWLEDVPAADYLCNVLGHSVPCDIGHESEPRLPSFNSLLSKGKAMLPSNGRNIASRYADVGVVPAHNDHLRPVDDIAGRPSFPSAERGRFRLRVPL